MTQMEPEPSSELARFNQVPYAAVVPVKERQPAPQDDENPPDLEAVEIRSTLLFAASPLFLNESGNEHPYPERADFPTQDKIIRPIMSRFSAKHHSIDRLVQLFIGPLPEMATVDITLRSEVETLTRVAFTFPGPTAAAIADGGLARFADTRDLDLDQLIALVDKIDALRNDIGDDGPMSYDETPPEDRREVDEQMDEVTSGRDSDILVPENSEPSCSDDAGDGVEVLILLAFGGTGPFPDPGDPTEPERWPDIFPSGWASVDLVRPWIAGSYPNPQVTGRAATIREVVLLPNPFDSPVHLDVERTEFRSLTDSSVRQLVLTYSLALPHSAMTTDEGFISLKMVDDHPIDAHSQWRGLIGKRLVLTSPSYAALSQLVCPQWLGLVSLV